jgi:ketosteroid isomerase-like protein
MSPVQDDVLAANDDFYAAFETADIDAMMAIWLDDPGTVCVHPGGPIVRGSAAIARSWSLIMANTPYIQFFLTDVEVSLIGDTATVSCTENVLTGDERLGTHHFGGATALATNIYTSVDGRWRLWAHHASPVLSSDHDEDSDD